MNKIGTSRPIVYFFDRLGIVLIHAGTLLALTRPIDAKLVELAAIFYVRGCSPSPPATTATSRTAPTRPAASSSSCSRCSARTATQKGPLWWAATHRVHHRYSDTPRDLH